MASESKPMDIEEEVDEIEDEIKKPEEGQVAERELNYKREPDAQDLTAPDVFARFRKETLPIFSRKFSNPFKKKKPKKLKIGDLTWDDVKDDMKEQFEKEQVATDDPSEKHQLKHPSSEYDMYKSHEDVSELIEESLDLEEEGKRDRKKRKRPPTDSLQYSFYKSMLEFNNNIKKLDEKPYDPDEAEDITAGKYTGAKPRSRETGIGSGVFPSKLKPRRGVGRERVSHPKGVTLPKSKKPNKRRGAMGILGKAMAKLFKDITDSEAGKIPKKEIIPKKDSKKKEPKPKRMGVKVSETNLPAKIGAGKRVAGGKFQAARRQALNAQTSTNQLSSDDEQGVATPTKKPAKRTAGGMPWWAQRVVDNLASGHSVKPKDEPKPKLPKVDPKSGKSKYKPKRRNIRGKLPEKYNKPSQAGTDWSGKITTDKKGKQKIRKGLFFEY